MDSRSLQLALAELVRVIDSQPDGSAAPAEATEKSSAVEKSLRLRQAAADAQSSLDYLRMGIKYLVFDLEATRRENAYLRGLLDENEQQPG